MLQRFAHFLLFLAMTLTQREMLARATQCSGAGAHLAVVSSRNASGHVLTTVNLEHEARLPARAATLRLDVRPTATRCRGVRTDSIAITLHAPPPPPGPGYEEINGIGFYKMHEEKVTWDEAKAACEAEDAHLLILNSEAEAGAILQLTKRHPKVTSWIFCGFHDRDREGHYVTIFGQSLASTGFIRWNQNQPDNAHNTEHCGTVHPITVGLNDYPCTTKAPFICEQPA